MYTVTTNVNKRTQSSLTLKFAYTHKVQLQCIS